MEAVGENLNLGGGSLTEYMLKQEIAICQDSDIDPAEVQAHIVTIMNNPAIWAVVRNRNNPNDAYYPKTDYAARYAGQQVR